MGHPPRISDPPVEAGPVERICDTPTAADIHAQDEP
jgi:hypothetical protein